MDHGTLAPSSWQDMTDRWARNDQRPQGAWEVARVHDTDRLRASGEVFRDYQDNMASRRFGLAARATECCWRPVAGEARTRGDWREQLGAARQKAHVLSQQHSDTFVVVLSTGSRSVWGTHIQALDSVWVNGNKSPKENI